MQTLIHLFFAFIGTWGFTVYFNTPRHLVFITSLNGMFAYAIYLLVQHLTAGNSLSLFISSAVAALTVNLVAQILARVKKAPVIAFSTPGIVTLVPGGISYSMMRAFTLGQTVPALNFARDTIFVAGAIALGIGLGSGAYHLLYKLLPKKMKGKI